MYGKKSETKFTIQFSRTDSAHLRVVDILNRLERCFKAQYLVDAVLYYENRKKTRPVLDEKHIEAVVNKILGDRERNAAGIHPAVASAVPFPAGRIDYQPQTDTDNAFDDAIENLGADGFNAIAGALDMFRKK